MPYTFQVVFSGLCFHHAPPPKKPGEDTTEKGGDFDPAVLLVNAIEPRTSIDRKTHLHRHMPTLTFDPAHLDDYSLDVGSFETDFRLIPTGGEDGKSNGSFQDSLAVLDLKNKVLSFGINDADGFRELKVERKFGTSQYPTDEQESDFAWVPSLSSIDRRIRGLKRQCFDPIVGNPLVACRVELKHGHLRVRRVGRNRASGKPLLWDFVPNAYPGRSTAIHSTSAGKRLEPVVPRSASVGRPGRPRAPRSRTSDLGALCGGPQRHSDLPPRHLSGQERAW
jgi:hypothetical protein